MSRKRHTPEQIIGKLREAEVALACGQTVLEVCRTLGIAAFQIPLTRPAD